MTENTGIPGLISSREEPIGAKDRPIGSDGTVAERKDLTDRLTGWLGAAIAAYPRPEIPVEREWEVSIAALARQIPRIPRIATKPLGLLDRFGAVHVGPQQVGFNGKEVDWDRVVEIRTQPAWTCLTAEALQGAVDELAGHLPPMPGRAWAARTANGLLVSLYLAFFPSEGGILRLPGLLGNAGLDELAVVTEIVSKRRIAGKTTSESGTAANLLQLHLRESTQSILATARARGVPVVEIPNPNGEMGDLADRAASWRQAALRLRAKYANPSALADEESAEGAGDELADEGIGGKELADDAV